MIGDIQESDISRLKDTIINCLVSQLDCCRDIRNLKTKCYNDMSNYFEKQMVIYKDVIKLDKRSLKFDKQLLELDEKLSKFDRELKDDLIDYIDNYIEAYLKLEKKKREDNTSKVWLLLFFIFFLCIIIYLTIL